jgi:hypothetical protein
MKDNMEFQVYGKITVNVELDIEAATEEEAIQKATESLKDDYNLNIIGYNHDPKTDVELDLTAVEYED